MNVAKLREAIKEKKLTISQVAEKMGINQSTFYRKLNSKGESFSIAETKSLMRILNLTEEMWQEIFFTE